MAASFASPMSPPPPSLPLHRCLSTPHYTYNTHPKTPSSLTSPHLTPPPPHQHPPPPRTPTNLDAPVSNPPSPLNATWIVHAARVVLPPALTLSPALS
ncbi:uncharacterized protein EHS24_004145 [Apiotrichum porosum]|uniref:Uncharacterized protein n=1 Tax=Apiotrichum porosum TaxID=105984 RepID=A0A427Y4F6_9TREE|nr:uncharacterized protein EHS24_004145 [Apiotrichum porosum]RSH85958.1 hypothetical protein EHS24_004145 [Apiotrichum porosum]